MNPSTFHLIAGIAVGLALLPVLAFVIQQFAVQVGESEAVLVTSFGRHTQTLQEPGWHWLPTRLAPWVGMHRVSLRRDSQTLERIHINDARGTSVMLDLWMEVRVVDPVRATFSVVDWDKQLHDLVIHATGALLGNRDFADILSDRMELGKQLCEELAPETSRWGIAIEQVYLQQVTLLPEVSRQMLDSIAARLERAKADIEEDGRQRVALLDAETGRKCAHLVAEAKAQYPLAVGRALAKMDATPEVRTAYQELYGLSQLRPHRTVAFSGFAPGEFRAVDAAMIPGVGRAGEAEAGV